MREAQYQAKLINKLRVILPNCVILKNDPSYLQGVPDLLILFHDRWAMLEVKMDGNTNYEPNQEYYIGLLDDMSFASFINPQTEEDVLYELQCSFGIIGSPRIS